MTSWPVLLAVYEFIDWAQLLVIFMAIYYFIMFAIFQTDEDKKEDEERAEKFSEWVNDKLEDRKQKKKDEKEAKDKKSQFNRRKNLLGPAKGFLIKALKAAEKIRDDGLKSQTAESLSNAKKQAAKIKKNLISVRKLFRVIRHREKREDREYIQKLYDYNEYLIRESEALDNGMPGSHSDSDWASKVRTVKDHANNIVGGCGYLINSIDKFIDENKKEINSPPGSSSGGSTGVGSPPASRGRSSPARRGGSTGASGRRGSARPGGST